MPLKAVFEKAPLMPLQQVRLSYGQVRCESKEVKELYAVCCEHLDCPAVLEGAFGLACLLNDDAMKEEAASVILNSLKEIRQGKSVICFSDQIAIARASLAVYEYSVKREILADVLLWCAVLETKWDALIEDRSVRQHPADLMELLLRMYRLTGKHVLLRMCTRLRSSGMDWAGVLNTFSQPRPLKRTCTLTELNAAMADEKYNEAGYYTRKYLSNTAAALSDGMRFSIQCALYSGSGTQIAAAEKGWQTIAKQHGAVCGGTTADRLLEGNATHRAISAAAVGAWCEALCCAMLTEKTPWATDEVMKLALNAMPAAVKDHEIVPFQRVNDLNSSPVASGCFDPGEPGEHIIQCAARLSRGYCALYHSAVSVTRNGLNINVPVDGKYAVFFYDQLCVLSIRKNRIVIHGGENVRGQIGITVSAGCDGTDIRVNEDGAYRVKGGTRLAIERDWNDGDTITLIAPDSLHTFETHHQGIAVYDGLRLMAYPAADNDYAYAVCGEPFRRDDKIILPVRTVSEWPVNERILSDVRVHPNVTGDKKEITLVPYAETDQRISVFPKG